MKKLLLLLLLLLLPINCSSFEMPTINGYIGYKYIWSSIPQEIMPIDSKPELGLITTWEPSDHWGIYAQLTYEERNSLENMLVYGFVEYSNSIFHLPFRIQAGKLQDSLGLYNAARINPRTRPGGTTVPHAPYFHSLNLLLSSGYGIRTSLDIGDFTIDYSVTRPIVDSAEFSTFSSFNPLALKSNENFGDKQVVSLLYHQKNSKWRSKLSFHDVTLSNEIKDMQWFTLSTEYEAAKWNLVLEVGAVKLVDIDWSEGFSNLGCCGTIYGSYNVNKNLSIRTGYSIYYGPQRILDTVQQFVGYDDSLKYAHDVWIGGTYNIDNWDLMVDIHNVSGGNFIRPKDWTSQADFKNWWYVGSSLVYHF